MSFSVLIFCPDRHIVYDGRTPDEVGVGGGITARVRMGRALARQGHSVIHVGLCPEPAMIDDVEYIPLDSFESAAVDVAVLTTSGDALDLSPVQGYAIRARKTIVWVHGAAKPGGLEDLEYDALYAVSRFIARHAVEQWGVPEGKVIVTYNGYEPCHFQGEPEEDRDPYRLIYFSHPSKGLEPALGVLRELRERDCRFHLLICGGEQLWGVEQSPFDLPEGASFLGLVGQKALARELQACGFALQLQRREEPGALAIPDSQRAACIIVASPVGVYPELLVEGSGAILVDGDALSARVQAKAARAIYELAERPTEMRSMREMAVRAARSIDETARQWTDHWDPLLVAG